MQNEHTVQTFVRVGAEEGIDVKQAQHEMAHS